MANASFQVKVFPRKPSGLLVYARFYKTDGTNKLHIFEVDNRQQMSDQLDAIQAGTAKDESPKDRSNDLPKLTTDQTQAGEYTERSL